MLVHWVDTETHTGTHVEVPAHMGEGGKSSGEMPLKFGEQRVSVEFVERMLIRVCRVIPRDPTGSCQTVWAGWRNGASATSPAPATFGKFGLQIDSSYSTMGSSNGQVIISGRFQF